MSTKSIDEAMPKLFEVRSRLYAGRKRKLFHMVVYPNWMHSKVLLVDHDSSEKAIAMMGTHNFMTGGVKFGTEEIALQSTNPRFIRNLSNYYDSIYTTAISQSKSI